MCFTLLFLVFLFVDLGTSGKPKGVTISHASLLVQSLAKLALVGYREDDVRLSWETFFTESFHIRRNGLM